MTAKTAHGEHVDSAYVMVKRHTDEGIVGFGEGTLAPRWSGEIAGKAAGVPVYRLLGGRVRESLPLKMIVGASDVPKASDLARQFLDWGARHLKVKVGLDPAADIARVRAVRELAGREVTIGIDGNCGWNIATARKALTQLEELDILFAEQPIGTVDPRSLVTLRQSTTIPLMADESVFTEAEAQHLVPRGPGTWRRYRRTANREVPSSMITFTRENTMPNQLVRP